MKLQCMTCSVISCAVYLASVGTESLNTFPSFPPHPCLVHKIYMKKKAGITNTYMPSRYQEEISELSWRGLLQAITAGEGMPSALHGHHQGRRSPFTGQSRAGAPLAPLNSIPLCYLSQQLYRINQSWSFPLPLPQCSGEAYKDTQLLREE